MPASRANPPARPLLSSLVASAATPALWMGLAFAIWAEPAAARSVATIFKCPGAPVIYTTDARVAHEGGCPAIGMPVIATRQRVQRSPAAQSQAQGRPSEAGLVPKRATANEPAPAFVESTGVSTASYAPPPAGARSSYVIPAEVQQRRDRDRLGVLQDELAREREKLARLKARLLEVRAAETAGKPVSTQSAELELAIARCESDITALSREVTLASR